MPNPTTTPTTTPTTAPSTTPFPERHTDPWEICPQQQRELGSPDVQP
jgi:hypothetical protein